MNRRAFLSCSTGIVGLAFSSCRHSPTGLASSANITSGQLPPASFFFVSKGRTAMMRADGSGLRHLEFDVPNQATWQPGPIFADGRRLILLSMEPRRDGPGKPFEEYYTQTPTHLWVHHLDTGTLEEIATRDRMAVFYTPALLLDDNRMLVQVVRNRVGQIFSMRMDGSDAREFTRAGEGLPYGLSLSPDGSRVAFHLASPQGYQIWTSDPNGGSRVRIAAGEGHLYFGTSWSPDGQWILYQDCHHTSDPGHDWSDICIGRRDGTAHRVLTTGQVHWFGATYGSAAQKGGGSNMPAWARDGSVLFARKLPGSKVPWEYQADKPDLDHFNREFKPELARGGTEICRLNPSNGSITRLSSPGPGTWDFRASESPGGDHILFCRVRNGGQPAVWRMNPDGSDPRLLTRGIEESGADHPRWITRG